MKHTALEGSHPSDSEHTPEWDLKIQREFEAKNPGPPKRRIRKKTAFINISDDEPDEHLEKVDDEPDEQLGRMDDEWTQALWDDLIKDKAEYLDIRDALKHGGKRCQEDPSSKKMQRPCEGGPNETEAKTAGAKMQTKPKKSYI